MLRTVFIAVTVVAVATLVAAAPHAPLDVVSLGEISRVGDAWDEQAE